MLHENETWAPTSCDLHRLQHNDRAVIPVRFHHRGPSQLDSQDLLERMHLDDLVKVLRNH